MSVNEIEQRIEAISRHYCELLCKTKSPEEKQKIFNAFYGSLLLVQQIKIDEICDRIRSKRMSL
ncbi:hypothetical protein [Persephonella sp.]|uniref:hypothetical protein n=1 Tax=Persephonella sp. TaxID=2060922 RepID=UPI0025DB85CD|nr:hypothetical protein [Persephonella sp.]